MTYYASKAHSNCLDCPLFEKGRQVRDRLPPATWSGLAIIGEMPGRQEVEQGECFVGASGKLLDAVGKSLRHEPYFVTNAIRCGLPHGSKPSTSDMLKAAECCRASVLANLDHLAVRAAICLGSTPMWSFMGLGKWHPQNGATGIMDMRGVCLPSEPDFPYTLTCSYHPAFILRAQEQLLEILRDDLHKAYQLARGERSFYDPHIGDWRDVKAVCAALEEALHAKSRPVAIDLETTSKDAMTTSIKTFGFSYNQVGWSIPWQNCYSKYSQDDWLDIYANIRRLLLSDAPKVFQNKQFDIPILERLVVEVRGTRYDTLLMHHDVYPKVPHDLEAIATQYMVLEPWKTEFKNKDWTEIEVGGEFDALIKYNALDCLTTEYCYHALRQEAIKLGVEDLVEHDTVNGDFAIDLYTNGILIDVPLVNKLETRYATKISGLSKQLVDYVRSVVEDPTELGILTLYDGVKVRCSAKQQEKLLGDLREVDPDIRARVLNTAWIYLEEPSQTVRDWLKDHERVVVEVDTTEKEWQLKKFGYNPSSDTQLRKLLFGVLRLTPRKLTATLKKSVSADALMELHGDTPYLDLHEEYTEASQIHSSYLKDVETKRTREGHPYLYDDGCVHPNWKIQQTPSGRYGTSPQVQNFTEDMLEMMIPHDGCLIIGADYAALEVRVIAALSPDYPLIDQFLANEDVHALHARDLYYPTIWAKAVEEGNTSLLKTLRSNGKGITFGKNYRGGYGAVFQQIRKDRRDEPEDQLRREVQILCDAYDRGHPAIVRAASHYWDFANRRNHLRTAITGRLRKWPMGNAAPTDCANHPIQGCLPASTRVLTRKGMLPIGDIPEAGETWTGASWAPYRKLNRGSWEIAKLHLQNGAELKCDTRHEVLVEGVEGYEFRSFEDLQIGEHVCTSIAKPMNFGNTEVLLDGALGGPPDDHDCYWMGYAIGNGHTTNGKNHCNSLTLTIGDRIGTHLRETMLQRFKAYTVYRWGLAAQKPHRRSGCLSVTVENMAVRQSWEALGYPWGETSHTKRIPTSLWKAPLSRRKIFLLGLMHADGGIGDGVKSSPNLHMCNRELLLEVQILARTCGIESRLIKTQDGWRLDFNGYQMFKLLRHGHPRQSLRMNMLAPSFQSKEFIRRVPVASMLSTKSHKTLHRKLCKGGQVGVYTLLALYRDAKVTPPEIYASYSLISKEALNYEEETYTLSVNSPLHRFDSEGVISKNTAADIINTQTQVWVDDLKRAGRYNAGVWPILQVHDAIFAEVEIPFVEEERQRLEDCLSTTLTITSPVNGEDITMTFPAEATFGRDVREAKLGGLMKLYQLFLEARTLWEVTKWSQDHQEAVTLFTGLGLSL